jgi:hypothetical protein
MSFSLQNKIFRSYSWSWFLLWKLDIHSYTDPSVINVGQWLAAGRWFSLGTPKTGCPDITEILLKVALNTMNIPSLTRLPHCTYMLYWVNQFLLLLLFTARIVCGKAAPTNFIVFSLTLPKIEPLAFCTRSGNANSYSTKMVYIII